jgi:general secretion pathway protein H
MVFPPGPADGAGGQRGFTLLEILLVMFVVGMVASLAMISFTQNNSKQLQEEARRLKHIIELASEEAILQGVELAVSFQSDAYQFLMLNAEDAKWYEMEQKPFHNHQLAEGIRLSYSLESGQMDEEMAKRITQLGKQSESKNSLPMLLLLSSGEISAFSIQLNHDADRLALTMQGDSLGAIEIYEQ